MKKRTTKIILIICLILFVISINFTNVQATSASDILGGVENFEAARNNITSNSVSGGMEIDGHDLQNMSNLVYNILLTIGIVAAVIVGLILGMKFMTGSIDQKAQVKESLIPYIAGCVVIFGAFGIWKLVLTILNQM